MLILWTLLCLGVWHLALGSDGYVLALFLAITAIGLRALMRPGGLWFGDLLLAASAFYAGGFALAIKAALGQPLQANLHHPQAAATALFLGILALAAAAGIARAIAGRRRSFPLAAPLTRPGVQRALFLPLLALGFLVLSLHVALRPRLADGVLDHGGGFGGLGSLRFILPLALALGIARLMQGTDGTGGGHRRAPRPAALGVALSGALLLLLSITSNTRQEFGEFLLMLSAGPLIFPGRRWGWPLLAALVLAAGTALYAAPLIHLMRGSFLTLDWAGRLQLGAEILVQHGFDPRRLRAAEGAFLAGFGHAWSENGSYIWPATLPLDRFMLVLPVDQVLRQGAGGMGLAPFLREVAEGVLPSVLIAKSAATGADLVAWAHGIRQYGNAARPVIGLTASALAAAGWAGVLVLPLLVALPVMLVANLMLGPLRGRAAGLFAVALVWVLPEYTLDALAVFGLRSLGLVALLLALLALLTRAWRPRPAMPPLPQSPAAAAAGT